MTRLLLVLAVALAAIALACSAGGQSASPAPATPRPTETATESPTATPTPPDPASTPAPPPGGATGIGAVDGFLEIRERGDAGALAALVKRSEVPCKLPSEAEYWVHCPPGAPSGTPVEAFPWWGCHGPFSNAGTDRQIGEFFSTFAGDLHSVLRFVPDGELGVFDERRRSRSSSTAPPTGSPGRRCSTMPAASTAS